MKRCMQLLDVYRAPYAEDVLYQLLSERPKENCISHEKMPSLEEHAAFIDSRPFRYWYVIEAHGVPVGAVEVTDLNEIGVAILKKYQRLGLARQALSLFMSTHEPLPAIPAKRNGKWLANIAVNNRSSKKFFSAVGFRPLQETYVLN